MANEWFYTNNGEKRGPVSDGDLKRLASTGQLIADDLIWKTGMEKWVEARSAKNLFFSVPSNPPPLPVPIATEPVGPPPVPSSQLWKAIIAKQKAKVVCINHSLGLGTGIMIAESGLIVTNRHVVDNIDFVNLSYSDQTIGKGAVLHVSKEDDLAIIQATNDAKFFFDLSIEGADVVEEGDEVIAIGHPHGNKFSVTRGIISSTARKISNQTFIQHDVAINPGNSGGPLIDISGKLVGINTFSRSQADGMGFAIPKTRVIQYIESVTRQITLGTIALRQKADIVDADTDLSPEQALRCAVSMLEESRFERADNGVYTISLPNRHTFCALTTDDLLACFHYVLSFKNKPMPCPNLLFQILEINDSLIQVNFSINDDKDLCIRAERFLNGMDAFEALSILREMARVILNWSDSIRKAF